MARQMHCYVLRITILSMRCKKRNILVVDQNPELLRRFNAAFIHSGYEVTVTDRIDEAFALVNRANQSAGPFDLVVVDISSDGHRGFVGEVQNINSKIPVFTLKNALDKSLLIDLLNQKHVDFIERFIESHKKTATVRPRKQGERTV
jgi:DNA-binding response OmpR family regulator